jgi:hypothetical protein
MAARLGLDPGAVASARDVLNFIAALRWPWPERVSLLARLAREARADVGTVLGGLALKAAPLEGFDLLIPLIGLAEKRVAGLVRALAPVDVAELSPESEELRRAREEIEALRGELEAIRAAQGFAMEPAELESVRKAITALRVENDALVTELDRLRYYARLPEGGVVPSSTAMALDELAGSVGSQVVSADAALRAAPMGLRLAGLELRLQGRGARVGEQVGLDLGAPAGGSSVTLAFSPGGAPPAAASDVPVPDVRGYGVALARRKLQAAGLASTVMSTGEGAAVVREQAPSPGTSALPGTAVRLVLGGQG